MNRRSIAYVCLIALAVSASALWTRNSDGARPTVRNECGPPRRQGEPFLPHATRAATSFRDHGDCVSSKSSSTHFTSGWDTLRRRQPLPPAWSQRSS